MGELSTQVNDVRQTLQAKADRIMEAAAAHVNAPRLIEMAARCCIANPQLLECSRASLVSAVAEAANLGLELGGVMGQAYLVPYGDTAQLLPGYLGLKELAYRSNQVSVLDANVVHSGDEFEYMLGTECYLKHRPSDEPTSIPTHFYAIAKTIHGEWVVRVMSTSEVEAHRNKFARGHNRKDSPWKTNFEAMGSKTVLRRLYKLLPLASEIQALVNRDEYIDHGTPADKLQSGDTAPPDDLDELASDETDATKTDHAPAAKDKDQVDEQEATLASSELPF